MTASCNDNGSIAYTAVGRKGGDHVSRGVGRWWCAVRPKATSHVCVTWTLKSRASCKEPRVRLFMVDAHVFLMACTVYYTRWNLQLYMYSACLLPRESRMIKPYGKRKPHCTFRWGWGWRFQSPARHDWVLCYQSKKYISTTNQVQCVLQKTEAATSAGTHP